MTFKRALQTLPLGLRENDLNSILNTADVNMDSNIPYLDFLVFLQEHEYQNRENFRKNDLQ